MAGVSSKAAAVELDNLPAELRTPTPPTRSKVLMGNGKLLAYFYDENRIYVQLDKIAPVMRQAQLAIEDHRFYEHGALDFKGTLRALVRNTSGDGRPGWLLDHPAVREDGADRGLHGQGRHASASRTRQATDRSSARSASCATRSRWRRSSPRTRSSSATSTSPTTARARTGSRRPRGTTTARAPRS